MANNVLCCDGISGFCYLRLKSGWMRMRNDFPMRKNDFPMSRSGFPNLKKKNFPKKNDLWKSCSRNGCLKKKNFSVMNSNCCYRQVWNKSCYYCRKDESRNRCCC